MGSDPWPVGTYPMQLVHLPQPPHMFRLSFFPYISQTKIDKVHVLQKAWVPWLLLEKYRCYRQTRVKGSKAGSAMQ